MFLKNLSRLCIVLLTVSISVWTVGCGSPASNPPAKPTKPAETPTEATPPEAAPAEAGSTTGGAGAEVPEGSKEAKKEKSGS